MMCVLPVKAKVVVVNHHLFFADRLLKDTGFAELLPDPDVVIFDEAHLVPDICINYFGSHISSREIDLLLNGIIKIHKQVIRDSIQIEQLSQRGLVALSDWHNAMYDNQVSDWRKVLANKQLATVSWALQQSLTDLANVLRHHLGREDLLDLAFEQLHELAEKLQD